MARQQNARNGIISAAADLFYADGIRAVSMDAVAERAGLTKRTLYYHFDSKDDLVAAYLEERDQPNLDRFRTWFDKAEGGLAEKVEAVFRHLAMASRNRKWNGCGFLRTAAELANMPGHPAVRAARAHKKRVEDWLASECAAAGCREPDVLGRRLMVLLDGGFASVMMHRDPAYMEAAGEAAAALVSAELRQRDEG